MTLTDRLFPTDTQPGVENTKRIIVMLAMLLSACASAATPFTIATSNATNPALPTLGATNAPQPWDAALTLNPVEALTINGVVYASSSKLTLRWNVPEQTVDHYQITLVEDFSGGVITYTADRQSTELTFTGLKASTGYTASAVACLDAVCGQSLSARLTADGQTAQEAWQLQGTGNELSTTTQVVSNGSTLSYFIQYGSEADIALAGRVQFYYNPNPGTAAWPGGLRIAQQDTPGTDLAALSNFTPFNSGLIQPCSIRRDISTCPGGALYQISASQAIPLTSGKVRMYFEASDLSTSQWITRIYYLDSQDGLTGRDFNSSSSEICKDSDYAPGNACALTVAIGSQGDAIMGDTGLKHARQFKIGLPLRDTWLWDEAPGTFMVLTGEDSCGAVPHNGLFYGVWDGTRWVVAQDPKGCATPLVKLAQGPVVVHLGGAGYKLYYFDESPGQDVRVLRLLYADGTLTGDPGLVDFNDWEASANARATQFLWPNGEVMDARAAADVNDQVIMIPTNDFSYQIMYLNLGDPSTGLGIAVLINP